MNKKGSTLIELVISIALISIIMMFMMKLLVDLNNMQTNTDYAIDNQINRAEIIKYIENDIDQKNITNVISESGRVTLTAQSGSSATIEVTSDTITYNPFSGEIRSWKIENAQADPGDIVIIDDEDAQNYYFQIQIKIYTLNDRNSKENNNELDDIIIDYINI